MAGLRVVRGPDWNCSDDDGGEGHLGTVLAVHRNETVHVLWDIGTQSNCRIGKDNKFDLRVFDNASVGVLFKNKTCTECRREPFFGMCWECKDCSHVNICSICYFTSKHDVGHSFTRYTMPYSSGVEVSKRSISQALRSFGMYPGARVVRGKDWEYGDQDGGRGNVGQIKDIRSFKKDLSHRNAVGVVWPSGKGYAYRLGYKGKVDLKTEEVARGFEYFRDHLPVLDEKMLKEQVFSQSTVVVSIGDHVCIKLSVSELKEAQQKFGGYHEEMASAIGKRGTVDGFTSNGGIIVKYNQNRWILNPKALSKVMVMSLGDTVRIKDDQKTVEALQKGHGEWNPSMAKVLGKVGKIVRQTPKSDVVVAFGKKHWIFNKACLIPAPNEAVDEVEEKEDFSMSMATGLANGLGLLLAQLQMLEEQKTRMSPEQFLKMAADGNASMVTKMARGEPDLCNKLIKGTTALLAACFEGHDEVVKTLIDNGAKLDMTDQNGNTALLAAISADKRTTVKILVDAGCDVNAANQNGRTPIHVASKSGLVDLAKLLITKGCNVNAQDSEGDTPLHDAIAEENDDIIVILANVKGINFRLHNKKGFNTLHYAVLKGSKTATNKITGKCREMTNDRKTDGITALHIAALNNRTELAIILLLQGQADTEAVSREGRTPLHLACIEAYYDIVKILLDHNARPSTKDNDGNTPLHCVLGGQRSQALILVLMGSQVQDKTERVKIACMLVEFGAKIDEVNAKGKQAIDMTEDEDTKATVRKCAEQASKQRGKAGRDRPNSGGKEKKMFQEMIVPCFVCFGETGSVTTDPCGHRCLCPSCSFKVEECPVCLTAIERRVDPRGNVLQFVPLDLCKVQ